MSVVFEATIKEDGLGGWYIELKDTVSGRMENCSDLQVFSDTIETMGSAYGGHIDQVKWQADANVPQSHISEVALAIDAYQRAQEKPL